MTLHVGQTSRPSPMVTETAWTRKYKRALLERNPVVQISCIQEARHVMKARAKQLPEYSPERQTIERALSILSSICEARAIHDR